MEPTPELIDALYREQVLRARSASLQEKLLDGPRLFDRACSLMKDGIRMQYPEASEEEVRKILVKRLDIVKKVEDAQ